MDCENKLVFGEFINSLETADEKKKHDFDALKNMDCSELAPSTLGIFRVSPEESSQVSISLVNKVRSTYAARSKSNCSELQDIYVKLGRGCHVLCVPKGHHQYNATYEEVIYYLEVIAKNKYADNCCYKPKYAALSSCGNKVARIGLIGISKFVLGRYLGLLFMELVNTLVDRQLQSDQCECKIKEALKCQLSFETIKFMVIALFANNWPKRIDALQELSKLLAVPLHDYTAYRDVLLEKLTKILKNMEVTGGDLENLFELTAGSTRCLSCAGDLKVCPANDFILSIYNQPLHSMPKEEPIDETIYLIVECDANEIDAP